VSHNNKPTIIVTCVSFGCHIKDQPFSPADCERENRVVVCEEMILWMGDVCVFSFIVVFFLRAWCGGSEVIFRKSAVTAFTNDNRERLSHHCHAVDCRSTEMCQTLIEFDLIFLVSTNCITRWTCSTLNVIIYISGVTEKTKGVKWKLKAVDKSRYISAAANKRKGKKKTKNEETREVEFETCKISHRVRRSRRIKSKVGINGITERER
jgi:hypothetical protein